MMVDHLLHQRTDEGVLQGIACCDVHLFDGWGQTMNRCGEDGLITHHNHRFLSVSNSVLLLEPTTDIAGLHILGRCTDERYLLVVIQMVIDIFIVIIELIGEA